VPRLDRALTRLALVAALTAALGLTACGRKGPLEPPPSASITAPPAQGPAGQQRYDAAGKPIAPERQQKTFFLDWLLN
jgi:predicted small lipoprotein YifL